jgi:hypothetical protein
VVLLLPALNYAELQRFYAESGELQVVYDDVASLAWMADMSDVSSIYSMDYPEQLAVVSSMNLPGNRFYGLGGWHIATETELEKLVQNPLSDIAISFMLHWFQNTGVASGRYENNINPPVTGKHHKFNVTQLLCCEPYPSGTFPYEELIEYPGPGNDIFFYAAPVPTTGIPNGEDQTPDVNAYGFGAWVVTSQVVLHNGQLLPMRCWKIFGRTICIHPVPMKIAISIFSFLLLLGIVIWFIRYRKFSKKNA